MPRLLAIDDDPVSGRLLKALLNGEGLDVQHVESGTQALAEFAALSPDAVVLDIRLPDVDGLQVLQELGVRQPQLPVIMLTGHIDVKTAIRAMQLGAFDYLTKPVDREELVLTVRRALEQRALLLEVQDLRRRVVPGGALTAQMGTSPQVRRVVEQVSLVANSDLTVLIQGETGTGKELVAQAIHHESARRERPLTALDCGAIPEPLLESELFGHEKGAFTGAERPRAGHFLSAQGGTVFLDEIANLSPALQAKLLRVLESRQVTPVGGREAKALDVRFIAATNLDLAQRAHSGGFREDLYFRLAQFIIALPPLRERTGDIAYLARRFLDEVCLELRRPMVEISPGALQALQQHAWPGNVRELRNLIREAVLRSTEYVLTGKVVHSVLTRSPRSEPAATRPENPSHLALKDIAAAAVREAEYAAICAALRTAGGNKSAAARALRTDYKTLHLKIQRYGIRPRDFEP